MAAELAADFPALAAYATDLTKLARQGKLSPVGDHDLAIRKITQILS
jgi:ATP-dependent Clp protease ATP-binding subunit ClpA